MLAKIIPFEIEEHLAFMQWISLHPKLRDLIIYIPNDGKRSLQYGKRLKLMGLRKGVSDFFLPLPTATHHGLWIELKRKQKFIITREQTEWIERMKSYNYAAFIAHGCDEAIRIVNHYLEE